LSSSPGEPLNRAVSRFRAPNNTLFTKGLFYETTLADKSTVIYTLKDWDHAVEDVVYPSLYLKYLQANDPTEYRFATEYLEGWYHWEVLLSCSWFQPYVTRWRKELEVRMRSEALSRIIREAKTTSRDSFMANRYLLEKGWEPKESKNGRGRPSKEEIQKAATDIVRADNNLLDDYKRIVFPQ
jgi:hypothetical protein